VLNKKTKVFTPPDCPSTDAFFEDMFKEYKGSRFVSTSDILQVSDYIWWSNYHEGLNLKYAPMVHHTSTSHGLLFYDKSKTWGIAISGDGKANPEFEQMIVDTIDNECKDNILIFQDFSYWDQPSRQVHCCLSDFSVEYSQWYQDVCYRYHNNVNKLEDMSWTIDASTGKLTTITKG
jgi:hypothetical protein